MELSARMCEICVPKTLCTLQQSLQSNTPLLMEAHEGSAVRDKRDTHYNLGELAKL